ncbi:benzoate/H(+) symporter BenE family transporter [Pseudolysinimonas sp.]|uniref:benzoate/H(+) symporter BenE family transporter n=1 Tax=Pseudolysinimonas sp. TaxID=2680009 RepID=UPI003F7E6DD0
MPRPPRSASAPGASIAQPIVAGVVAAISGYTAAFAIVVAGLRAVGATPAEAGSGLLILTVFQGLLTIVMSLRFRQPLSFAWSTPGAALLVAAKGTTGDFRVAVGAFLLCGVLLVITGVWPWLARTMTRIPRPIASAMLAGILLPICLAPVHAAVRLPLLALPAILVWLVLLRLAPRWAVLGAVVSATVAIVATQPHLAGARLLPTLAFVLPSFDPLVLVSIGIPLYVVTMAGQNVPGFAVLRTFGYDTPPARGMLAASGAATVVGSFLGAHALNLSAISAALVAGPEAHPDRDRRWIAAFVCGVAYLVIAPLSGAATALVSASAPVLIEAVAGLALLGALVGAIVAAFEESDDRLVALVTFLVVAAGIQVAGIGAAFWGLVVGGVVMLWLRVGRRADPA